MRISEAVHRTREIEDYTNLYFIHPISGLLTPLFARLRIHPNTVSLVGVSCGLAAGFSYYHYQNIYWVLSGFLFMIFWHILDGVDGQLARLTNTQSDFGKAIDGFSDNLTFIAVYIAIGVALTKEGNSYVWPTLLIAGALHSIQAAAYEAQRQEFDFWGYDKQSAELRKLDINNYKITSQPFPKRLLSILLVLYTNMQHRVAGIDWSLRTQLAEALKEYPEHTNKIRAQYRQTFSRYVRYWAGLSSNYRTIGIFAFSLLNIPIVYFLIEILILTPLMLFLINLRKDPNKRFSEFLITLEK